LSKKVEIVARLKKETRMTNSKRILIAVDGSPSSHRTGSYVADMVAGNPAFQIGLLHLELPPRMLEWGGSENPVLEAQVSAERAETYRQVEQETIAKGKSVLKSLQQLLAEKGVDVTARLVQFEEPLDWKLIVDHLLKTATEHNYGTVVVGRHPRSWLQRLFQHHVATELVQSGEGVTIWAVG
jgi:nucleotide-binding universal stress UspA family protein